MAVEPIACAWPSSRAGTEFPQAGICTSNDLRGDPNELQLGLGRVLQVHRRGQRDLSRLVRDRFGLDHRHRRRSLDHRPAAGLGARRHAYRAEPAGIGHRYLLRGTLS
ncbi:hypothetical protein EMIT0P228_130153 [Pseudomonas brassicacearum]